MKLILANICPPIPIRTYDWAAYFDGSEEDGPCGHGKTQMDALYDLLWQIVSAEEERVVQQHMDALEAVK